MFLLVSASGIRTHVIEYHTDLTIPYGILFIWSGKITNFVGQGIPYPVFTRIANICRNIIRKVLDRPVVRLTDELAEPVDLRDGQKAYSFCRFGYWSKASSDDLPKLISQKNLELLKKRKGISVIYVHLGNRRNSKAILDEQSQESIRNLAQEYSYGNIYVTTTAKLLTYYVTSKYLNWSVSGGRGSINIIIHGVDDEVRGKFVPELSDLQGITFYTSSAAKTRVFLDGSEIEIERNTRDETNKESVSIPLSTLTYPVELS